MKKKNPKHPKLYLDIIHQPNQIILTYISNRFDQNGSRIIEQEILNKVIHENDKNYLIDENSKQLSLLKKYIEIQKKVLVKYQKDRNYDSGKILNSSIKSMIGFEQTFEDWFGKNIK